MYLCKISKVDKFCIMTVDILLEILSKGESVNVEFKEAKNKVPNTLYETVVSFMNREGGTIVLGANDEGVITGIDREVVDKMKKEIVTALNSKDLISPPVNFPIFPIESDGLIVLCLEISSSSQVHRYKGVIYDRENDSDIRIEDNARISELYLRKRNYYTENEILPFLAMKDLSDDIFDKARTIIRSVNASHAWLRRSNMDILRSSGLYRRDIRTGKEGLTLAAAFVFGTDQTIQNLNPAYKFDVLVRMNDTERWDDKLTLRTNLIDTYLLVMDFIRNRSKLPNKFYLEDDLRKDLREIIFREIIANVIIHREYTNGYATQMIIHRNRVEVTNPNTPLSRGLLSMGSFIPYAKNPNLRKFFSELGWADEIGSGLINIYKYTKIYSPGSTPLFIDDDQFKTIIPLIGTMLGEEKAMALVELVGLKISDLNIDMQSAVKSLNIDPLYAEVDNIDEFFFAKKKSLGWSWMQNGVEMDKLRIKIFSELQDNPSFKEWSWKEKGVELFDKRTMTLFKLLLICLKPQNIEEIQNLIDFNSRNKLREMYINPLRDFNLLEYTIKDKPNSSNQKYVTTETGKKFLGGFSV